MDSNKEVYLMDFRHMFERLVLLALIGFLGVFLLSAVMEARDVRQLLAMYSFFVMGLYIFRGWFFKLPYDKGPIIGCALLGIYAGYVARYGIA